MIGKISHSQVGEMSTGEMSVGKMYVGEMSIGKMSKYRSHHLQFVQCPITMEKLPVSTVHSLVLTSANSHITDHHRAVALQERHILVSH